MEHIRFFHVAIQLYWASFYDAYAYTGDPVRHISICCILCCDYLCRSLEVQDLHDKVMEFEVSFAAVLEKLVTLFEKLFSFSSSRQILAGKILLRATCNESLELSA